MVIDAWKGAVLLDVDSSTYSATERLKECGRFSRQGPFTQDRGGRQGVFWPVWARMKIAHIACSRCPDAFPSLKCSTIVWRERSSLCIGMPDDKNMHADGEFIAPVDVTYLSLNCPKKPSNHNSARILMQRDRHKHFSIDLI